MATVAINGEEVAMPGELMHYLTTTAVERQRSRELDAVDHATEVAIARVGGVNRATQCAMFETMHTHMLKKQAEAVAPDGAELYTMIAIAGAVESTRVIEGMNRRRCGR
jgi:hypothetical protein